MNLLIVIYADPAKSGLTAEALRMGMGLGVTSRNLQLVLMGAAAQVLTDEVDELVDGEMMENHLEVFEDWGTKVFVETSATKNYDLSGSPLEVIPVSHDEVASMFSDAADVMVFP